MLKQILQTLFIGSCMLTPGLARGGVLTADGAKTAAATFFPQRGCLSFGRR